NKATHLIDDVEKLDADEITFTAVVDSNDKSVKFSAKPVYADGAELDVAGTILYIDSDEDDMEIGVKDGSIKDAQKINGKWQANALVIGNNGDIELLIVDQGTYLKNDVYKGNVDGANTVYGDGSVTPDPKPEEPGTIETLPNKSDMPVSISNGADARYVDGKLYVQMYANTVPAGAATMDAKIVVTEQPTGKVTYLDAKDVAVTEGTTTSKVAVYELATASATTNLSIAVNNAAATSFFVKYVDGANKDITADMVKAGASKTVKAAQDSTLTFPVAKVGAEYKVKVTGADFNYDNDLTSGTQSNALDKALTVKATAKNALTTQPEIKIETEMTKRNIQFTGKPVMSAGITTVKVNENAVAANVSDAASALTSADVMEVILDKATASSGDTLTVKYKINGGEEKSKANIAVNSVDRKTLKVSDVFDFAASTEDLTIEITGVELWTNLTLPSNYNVATPGPHNDVTFGSTYKLFIGDNKEPVTDTSKAIPMLYGTKIKIEVNGNNGTASSTGAKLTVTADGVSENGDALVFKATDTANAVKSTISFDLTVVKSFGDLAVAGAEI
ncbi:MAG: hypothetical protein MR286_03375, partial [Clostridiales bacterium]|nr:hypothetical protein [Clostridiales bacterium]